MARAAADACFPVRFVGDGPDVEQIRRANPDALITGWRNRREVRETLLRARALVLPSRWHETFGLCVAEAQSLGVPVIVSCLAGSADWVEHGVDGAIFDPYVAGDLKEKLHLVRSDLSVQRMGEAAYQRFAARDTSLTHHAHQLLSAYGTLVPSFLDAVAGSSAA